MDLLLLVFLALGAAFVLRAKAQKQRIQLLAHYLRNYDIEKLMERLAGGYMRALGESDPARQAQIWELQLPVEKSLSSQFSSFASTLAQAPEPGGTGFRIDNQPLAFPLSRLIARLRGSRGAFDLRTAINLHADGINRVAQNAAGLAPRDKAYTLLAELYLMQHTCHWFCKSRAVASARMQLRNQTSYEQVVQSVSPETRQAYLALIGAR